MPEFGTLRRAFNSKPTQSPKDPKKSIRIILKEKNHVQQKISRILFVRMREIFF